MSSTRLPSSPPPILDQQRFVTLVALPRDRSLRSPQILMKPAKMSFLCARDATLLLCMNERTHRASVCIVCESDNI
jgi:hypothetical protein